MKQLKQLFVLLMIFAFLLAACEDNYYYENENNGYYDDSNYDDANDYDDNEDDSSNENSGGENAGTVDSNNVTADADSGFRPEINGFNFENYGNESVSANLTAIEMQRMFGDQVCASGAGGDCILTPPAKRWMNEINEYMDGGHCEGMAVLSWLMYAGQVDPNDFGASTTHALSLNNEALQREIAYWWTTQATTPADTVRVADRPSTIVEILIETFYGDANDGEQWVMGIYMSDFSGGHAITPFAVEDQGNDIMHVLVYDNNWPDQIRYVVVDMKNETWSYQASTNPNEPESLYEGDASTETLEIVGITQRIVQQECTFCAGGQTGMNGLALAAQQYNQIWLNGQADLLITDEDGNRLGFAEGQFVNEIPGARGDNMKYGVDIWDIDNEPVYFIPLGVQFSITIDASRATEGITSDITMIGPGYNLVIADLYLDPGTSDTITVSPDGSMLTYSTEYNDAPDMIFGVETAAADYEFIVAALDIEAGAEFEIELDVEQGSLNINTDNTTEYGTYEIVMYRVDDEGEAWFNNNDIYLEPGDTAYLWFADWAGPGSSMFIDIDYGSDGSVDETLELVDEFGTE